MAITNQNIPVSQIIRNQNEFDDEPKKKSREDWRKAKELDEARKAGTAPAAVDEEGKDINPHIPQYISSAPWYYGTTGPTLKHQRPQKDKEKFFSDINDWYKRGVDTTKTTFKYRKGACENCGAMTHKRKDCMERPRKIGAKYNGAMIASDEFIQPEFSMSYDGKRDRWSGYDASEHKSIIEEFQKIEEAKRQLRAEKLSADDKEAEEEEEEENEDEDKYVDEVDMPGTKVDSKQRITVRNLRIREDTAKYLRNLDPNSAYYDPKTRSMRDNPHIGTRSEQDFDYAGENYNRFTGDTQKHAVAQLFAWEAYGKGVDVHLLAEPTKLEKLQQEYDKKKEQFKSEVQKNILEKYGGENHLNVPPKSLLLAQTEDYLEYSRYGKIIKGKEKETIRSKYEEDSYLNNHKSVWGSYWINGSWGYKCCHSLIKNSYCFGNNGKQTSDNALNEAEKSVFKQSQKNNSSTTSDCSNVPQISHILEDSISEEEIDLKLKSKNAIKKQKKKKYEKIKKMNRKKNDSKLKEALISEELQQKKALQILSTDERKIPYNSMYEVKKPTEEELEAYYIKRRRDEDPMAQFLD